MNLKTSEPVDDWKRGRWNVQPVKPWGGKTGKKSKVRPCTPDVAIDEPQVNELARSAGSGGVERDNHSKNWGKILLQLRATRK